MKFAEILYEETKQTALNRTRAEMDNMPLLGECLVWQAQIENAMASHANVRELETANMGA